MPKRCLGKLITGMLTTVGAHVGNDECESVPGGSVTAEAQRQFALHATHEKPWRYALGV